jgi:hypothetical protein
MQWGVKYSIPADHDFGTDILKDLKGAFGNR